MRISVDDKKVKRNARIGRYALIASLVILMGGLALTLFGQNFGLLDPQNSTLFFIIYLGILLLGFTVSRVGMFFGNRHISPLRPELALRENLKGLDRKYALMLFQQPTDYFLVEPGGVTAFIVRNQAGRTQFKAGQWKRRESFLQYWLGRDEPLGNPTHDAIAAQTKLSDIVAAKYPDLKVPIRAAIVFTNAKAMLDIEPSPIPILRAEDLKPFLRGDNKLRELPSSIQRKLREALGAPELPKAEGS
jgi:hypothetical protein